MDWLRRVLDRAGRKGGRDLDRELRSHLEAEAEEQLENGMTAEQARYAAGARWGMLPS
jgi:hypothetical protein